MLFGAGKSATVLIDYLLKNAEKENWHLHIADADKQLAMSKTGGHSAATCYGIDVTKEASRQELISGADIVISMMPPSLHALIAKDCLALGRHLLTASYADDALYSLHNEVKEKDLVFLSEMGLDPGIDHMSAMKIFDEIHEQGGSVKSFKSHCGGLVAPESDDNPWHYKISWNPRNVVLAGKAGAIFRENGDEKTVPYAQLFSQGMQVEVNDGGIETLSAYPNRNSLPYIDLYELHHAKDFIRTTLRYPSFMEGWHKLIELGFTDETPAYETDGMTLKQFFDRQLKFSSNWPYHQADAAFIKQLKNLGMEDDETEINKGFCSAADILQFAMEKNWALKPGDKDMVVMVHEVEYTLHNQHKKLTSSLVLNGSDDKRTAMAKTVGLPLGIGCKLILNGTIRSTGVQIPTTKNIYEPVLQELEAEGVCFKESVS